MVREVRTYSRRLQGRLLTGVLEVGRLQRTCLLVWRAESELVAARSGLGLLEGCPWKVRERDLVDRNAEVSEGRFQVS